MGSFLDMFAPGASQYWSPEQQSAAANRGLLNGSLALIDASSNHYGLRPSTLQIMGQGVKGYGQGVDAYNAAIAADAQAQQDQYKAMMGQLQTQRALQYFYPQGKGNGMAAALAPNAPQDYAPQGGLSSFYGPSAPPQALPPVAGSQVGAGYGDQAGGQFPPSAAGSPQTAFGLDVPSMARLLYKQGMDTMMMGQPGGDALIKQAIEMDPSIIASSENAKAGADYPYELGKIGATGAQARETESHKAGLTPLTQTVMINGVPTQIQSNNLAAATGQIPPSALPMPQVKPEMPLPMPGEKPRLPPPGAGAFNATTTTAPQGLGASGIPLDSIPPLDASALRPPQVSTSVPVGAVEGQKAKNEGMGRSDAEQLGKIKQSLSDIEDFSSSLKRYKTAIGDTSYTGPVGGYIGDIVAAPGRTNLISAQNELTLRAKGLLGMPSSNFSDADRDFISQIAGGNYGRAGGLQKAADRLEKMVADQKSNLLKQKQSLTGGPDTSGWSIKRVK